MPAWQVFRTNFLAQWGESNESAKALQKLKQYEWKTHKKDHIGRILTTVDTLLQESGITDEEQKKSFLRQVLPPSYGMFLAISRPETYEASVTALQQFEVELGQNVFTSHLGPSRSILMDPNVMDVD